ncbi:hypothetical protein A3I48_04395 [Candidatus Daviesbacteria bacterium RIFCSPLOWO2_02_FULL_36_7]|uniref:Core-binding (CB) domain-containing protein n=1 Tax=Candidatus Daviesbacteria bacterium RIFCSPLOWO2_02_FULL_36_7 TaxID=1797792 RepID=A0A1F5MH88_9BACT|nr:MAG: hypothetical protein A3I48_04395 [Candidatus Daviesbacteria bacterium RIFCSPLOWO2_02_FULL_36_7]
MSNLNTQNSKNPQDFHLFSNMDLIEDFFLFLQTNNYSPMTIYHYKNDLAIFDNFLKSRELRI